MKLAVQFVTTAMEVAMGLADCANNSVTKNQGMDPGPVANPMTKPMTMNIEMYDKKGAASTAAKQMRSMVVVANMMAKPVIISVFLPAFSIRTKETKVMATFTVPMPRVADWAAVSSRPADSKIEVEKNMAALMPLNCWASIIIMEMMRGALRDELISISLKVTLGSNFMLSCSCLMPSISVWTSWIWKTTKY